MSFAQTKTPRVRAIILLVYLMATAPIFLISFVAGMIGRCDYDGCVPLARYLLVFPGLAISVIAGFVLLFRWAMKG